MSDSTAIALAQYAMHLGVMPEATMTEALQLQTTEAQHMHWQGSLLQCAFITPYCAAESFNQRLLALLDGLLAKMPASPQEQIVYLVLPEFSGPDNPQLNALLQQLMQRHPRLLQSEQCRVFPYGAAGCLMALNAAAALLAQQPQAQVWLIATDSQCHADVFASYQAQQAAYLLSEGALAVCLTAAESGLALQFSATDVLSRTAENHQDLATAGLFCQVTQQLAGSGQQLKHICLPDSGNDNSSAHWLEQMPRLHGAINAETAYSLPSYQTGELGACGGLYRLLCLLQGAQKGRLHGLTLQYEQSAKGYRSVALYNPVVTTHD